MPHEPSLPHEIAVRVNRPEWAWEIEEAIRFAGFVQTGACSGPDGRDIYFRKPTREPRVPALIIVNHPEDDHA